MGDLKALLQQAGLEGSGEEEEASSDAAASEGGPAPAFAPKVVVRVQRKGHGGKTVTRVEGVTADVKGVAKRLKKALGTGARVDEGDVIVQGDQADRVVEWLQGQGAKKVVRG